MKTKRGDAASIVGSTWAEKLAAYEEKLKKKEKYKSAAEPELILKAMHRNRVFDLVEKANIAASIKRTNDRTYRIAYGPGSWDSKVQRMQFVVKSFINDLQDVGAWNDDVRRAVHRGVHRLRKSAEAAHVETLVERAEVAQREVAAITRDVRMRRVMGVS